MLSRKTVNNTGPSEHHVHEASSEPHIVVACPYCQTKFAVEGSLVASYEIPTFHCSRCDAVFEFPPLRKNGSSKGLPEATTTNHAQQHSTIRPSDFSLGNLDAEAENDSSSKTSSWVEKSAGRSLLGLSDSISSPLSITRQEFVARAERLGIDESSSTTSDIPEQKSNRSESNSFDIFSLFDAPSSNPPSEQASDTQPSKHANLGDTTQSPSGEPATQTASNKSFSSPPETAREQYDNRNTGASVLRHRGSASSGGNWEQPTKAASTRKKESPKSFFKGQLRSLLLSFSAKNKDLSRMVRPIVKVTMGLLMMALLTRLMPQTIDDVFGAVIPSALSGKRLYLPPTDLSVHDLTFTFEKTSSGEIIPIVRGMVSNSGETSFQNVMVEAIGFDSRGATLMRIKAPLRSALNREKLSDISVEDVKKFQTSIHTVASTIKPKETLPFTIAMLPEKPVHAEVAFFSARIFSLGR